MFQKLEPFVDGGDGHGGFVADGEFVVSGGHGAVAFEPVDAALDGVALFVGFGIEGGWASTAVALGSAIAGLVAFLGDGAADPAPAQVGTIGPAPVGLVRQDPVRAGAWAPTATARHPQAMEHGLKLRRIVPLPGSDHDRQGFLTLLASQMRLGGQPASGSAESVVVRLDGDPAGWFALPSPLLRAPAAC